MSSRLERLRKALPTILEAVLGLAVIAFVVISIWWFVEVVTDDRTLSARDAFVGLAYFAGVVLIVLVVWAAIRFLTGVGGRRVPPGSPLDGDRYIVVTQMRYGVALIAFGATIGIIFGLAFPDDKGIALSLGTAALGAGAAMLPGGASASATARMNKRQEAKDDEAAARATTETVRAATGTYTVPAATAAPAASGAEPEAEPADGAMAPDALAEHPDHPSNELDAGEAEIEGSAPELVGADEAVEGDAPPVLEDADDAADGADGDDAAGEGEEGDKPPTP